MTDKKENCGCGCVGQNQTPQKTPKASKGKTKPEKSKQCAVFPGEQEQAEDGMPTSAYFF